MSLTDIIFIGRNKAYGAYELRQSYNQNIKRALMGTLFFTAFAGGYQSIYAMIHPVSRDTVIEIVCNMDHNIEIKPPTLPKEQIKPELKHGNPEAATTALLEKKAVKDRADMVDTAEAIPMTDVAISDHATAGTPGEVAGAKDGGGIIDMHVTAPPKEIPTVTIAEFMPEFPGGEDALLKYIHRNISYPTYENEMGIQGKAVVGFVIDENGKVTNVRMIRGVSKGIDRESMRVISSLPDFKPGMQSGRKVRVSYVVPLDFHQATD